MHIGLLTCVCFLNRPILDSIVRLGQRRCTALHALMDDGRRIQQTSQWRGIAYIRRLEPCNTARGHHVRMVTPIYSDSDVAMRSAVATNACSVTRSLRLSNVEWVSNWMGDRQGRPSAVNRCPFVGVDLNRRPTVHIAVIVLTRTSINQSI